MKVSVIMSLMFFLMAFAVLISFTTPLQSFIGMEQNSQNLNCQGYIANGNVNSTLSFNSTLNGGGSGSPLGCLALQMYIPFILLAFLVAGVMLVLQGNDFGFGGGQEPSYQGGY